jgi:hypothetical protein
MKEDNIKVELKEMGLEVMQWVQLAQDREQNGALVNLRVA